MNSVLSADGREPPEMDCLNFMINHVFLPPRLPQEDDAGVERQLAMVQTLRDSVSDFVSVGCSSVRPALEMLDRFLETCPGAGRGQADMTTVLRSVISRLKGGDIVLFHLRAQNAGLLLTTCQDHILFEAFELLAPNKDVMSCKGALLREFPDRAALVPVDKLEDSEFLDELVDMIEKLDACTVPMARPKTTKAGTAQPEERDTLSPALATGMLIDVLVGLGQGVEPGRITKRSREQVGWNDATLPFHRSSTWLLLRVALRLVLDRLAADSWYKPLMVYHHARILGMAVGATRPKVASDKLFSMKAKVVRRVIKLNPVEEASWLPHVRMILRESEAVLNKRWKAVQNEDTKLLPLSGLSMLSFSQDAELKLRSLRQHLSWITSRLTGHRDPMGPGDTTRFDPLPQNALPALDSSASEDDILDRSRLLDFEAWVKSGLQAWLDDQLHLITTTHTASADTAMSNLKALIDAYHKRACAAYDGIPDGLSIMYLVIMELWVAMDRIGGKVIPLLLDYDPKFPLDVFHPLLLERKEEMGRLKAVEDYLIRRKTGAPSPYPSAFEGFGREDSFAVRFYHTSAEHQHLREEIENWGAKMKRKKLRKYEEMKEKHNALAQTCNGLTCDYYWDSRWEEYNHSRGCTRCRLEEKMNGLRIHVLEWPLPDNPNHARAVVVDISLPRAVQTWRDLTWSLITVVFREKSERLCENSGEKLYFAGSFGGLQRFHGKTSRLRPASTIKPMEVTHYRGKHILDATPSNICVPHAAKYTYHDEPLKLPAEEGTPGVSVPSHCSYAELARGLPVENWIRHATHTSNDVVAGQSRCPPDTTLDEFRAFGNLRSGVTLQWANVLGQLVIPSVDLNKKATFALILQSCLEAGPGATPLGGVNSIWRKAHLDTQNVSFMKRMLQALEEALERVRESWQNDVALCLLTCLATRLLSLSPSTDISNTLLEYLGRLRRVSIAWARLLLDKLNLSDADQERQGLVMAALICAATFNIGEEYLALVLSDSQELALLAESAVLARSHLPASGRPSDPIALQLMYTVMYVMYQARNVISREVVHKGNAGLDTAIKQFWTDYSRPSASWVPCNSETQGHVLECSNTTLSVSFNVLSGNLFINGYPLSKLPLAYQQHQTFKELFGGQVLDVGPSSVPGMQFSACRDQNGWVVHFAMKDSKLVVRTVRQTPQSGDELETWEYIPRRHLEEDLPNSFINDYSHWLNLSTNDVEFRPLGDKWTTSPQTWRLSLVSGRGMLKRGSCFVVDPASRTAELAHSILGSIECSGNINPIFDSNANCLILELPRFSISFWIREGETIVKSKNYTGMQVDERQGVGSLIGLSNKLVLKPNGGPGFRVVLVPRGQVSAHCVGATDHVKVDISTAETGHVRHDSFSIDTKLGGLTDTGSLQSKLYLCLLHALTSHCLPDPLTHRTGTEEALRLLGGAAIKSYPALDPGSRDLLQHIANISPRREYYPSHLQAMEQTTWNYNTPPLSQHDGFWPLAKSIYNDYETIGEIFQLRDSNQGAMFAAKDFKQSTAKRSVYLEQRARTRNSSFRLSEFGAESHAVPDEWYRPRNRTTNGSSGNRAMVAQLARCVGTGCLLFRPSSNLPQLIEDINGSRFYGSPKVDLAFNVEYLDHPSASLEGRWCGLHRALVAERNKYRKIFFLSSLLYAEGSDQNIVHALMAVGCIPVLSGAEMLPPLDRKFDLAINRDTLSVVLTKTVKNGAKRLEDCPEDSWPRLPGESIRSLEDRRARGWAAKSKDRINNFVAAVLSQIRFGWTVDTPIDDAYGFHLDVDVIMPEVRKKVEMARRSEAFQMYLASMSEAMGLVDLMEDNPTVFPNGGTVRPSGVSRLGFISAMSLFSQPAPLTNRPQPEPFTALCAKCLEPGQKHERLASLVEKISGTGLHDHQASYIAELRGSMMASSAIPRHLITVPKDDLTIQPALVQNLENAREAHNAVHGQLERALRTGPSIAHQICDEAGLYPRTSSIFFLQRLTRTFWSQLSMEWRQCLVNLALSLIYLQRAERLASHGDNLPERWSDLERELSNLGDHENPDWKPLEYPESLLLEIEQNIMIRAVQNSIAAEMRSPRDMESSTMQLNMGEGKSSVIVPVVTAALADGNRLVRVVVAKPQSSQMMHMLISKLGGLINRRVFYLPFSRSIQLSEDGIPKVRRMIEDCQSEGGVLLVQPEHLLSFKLMGIDKSSTGEEGKLKNTTGKEIIRLHQDFESISRDIVDESDENFSVQFELVYTMGTQQPCEMSPDRWIMVQELLGMLENVARRLMAAKDRMTVMSEGLLLKYHGNAGRVPVIRILEESAGQQLIRELATEVCHSGLIGFPVHHQTVRMRGAVLNYILLDNADKEDIAMVENSDLFSNPPTKDALLLLRGLLAEGVMLFVLSQKRFRVNYGLALDRQPPTMLAVPYRAKDIPSPRSEFSHPDVVIVTTCLTYYYRGLSDAELYTCLELLNKSDSAGEEYGRWSAASPNLAPSFRTFSSINLKDKARCSEIVFPGLRYTRPAVDFYMRTVVFPREMKQFPLKLSASGWDLAKPRTHPLTGFSGTLDSKICLPLAVKALDLQPHTNAMVLSTLLQEENTVLELGDPGGSQLAALTEDMLLGALGHSEPPMRVILDVGAQIIESSNLQMAEKLLDFVSPSEVDAVIFFSDQDELSVLTRNGMVDPFLTSPFAGSQLDRCFVYLDQSHTRGTDLKLPDNYRAAVTLGPGVTKDTLVQGCMRLRRLGQGQSVSFIVSPEMQKRIRNVGNITEPRPLAVSDVLTWAISETWDETTRSVPLWATQGIRHIRQERVWQQADEAGVFSSANIDEYLEPETMSLEKRYRPKLTPQDNDIADLMANLDLNTQPEASQLTAIKNKLAAFAHFTQTATLQEEQERELAPEIEEERQISRPSPRQALHHKLHPHLSHFIHNGDIPPNSPAFLRPFAALAKTSAARLFTPGLAAFPSDLLVSADFARTVDETGPRYCSDSYQRGAQWVLCSSKGEAKMVIISQWEANHLKVPLQQARAGVTLHAYLPRPSLTFRSMEDLTTYTVPATLPAGWAAPPELVMQLNLFAGQLYLRSYGEYVRLCRYLGLAYTENRGDEVVAPDGFVGTRGYPECGFGASPVAFLAEVYKKIRRDCVGIERTHMGRVLAGEILTERDFQEDFGEEGDGLVSGGGDGVES